MKKIAVRRFALSVAGLLCVTVLPMAAEDSHASTQPTTSPTTSARVTITGVSKTLIEQTDKMDPSAENASVTITGTSSTGNVTHTTYLVIGWAGVILAKRANGQQVEVTGVVGERHGQKTILARSIDIAINGVPIERQTAPAP